MNYEMTHVSLADESTAMLVREDRYFITLVNEDGYEWTDPADKWEPIGWTTEEVNAMAVAYGEAPDYSYEDQYWSGTGESMADDSYIDYLNNY